GSGSITLTAQLSAATTNTVTVQYGSSNGTAVAGSDYTAVSGTLTFNPGTTSQTVSVPITDDSLNEDDETFTVSLSSPDRAALTSPSTATDTILNNDAAPTVTWSRATASVGEGSASVTLTAELSAASGRTVTVHYASSNDTAVAG